MKKIKKCGQIFLTAACIFAFSWGVACSNVSTLLISIGLLIIYGFGITNIFCLGKGQLKNFNKSSIGDKIEKIHIGLLILAGMIVMTMFLVLGLCCAGNEAVPAGLVHWLIIALISLIVLSVSLWIKTLFII